MQNSEFEKVVQKQMEELKLEPRAVLWQQIEQQLPQPKKDRRWLLLLLLLPFIVAGIFTWKQFFPGNDSSNRTQTAQTPNRHKPAAQIETTGQQQQIMADSQMARRFAVQPYVNDNDRMARKEPEFFSRQRKKMLTGDPRTNPARRASEHKGRRSEAAKIYFATVAPVASADSNATAEALSTTVDLIPGKRTDSLQQAGEAVVPDVASTIPAAEQTAAGLTVAPRKMQKNVTAKHWSLGFEAGAGIANSKSALFKKTGTAYDYNGTNSTGSTAPQLRTPPESPRASASLSASVYVQKNLSERLLFHSGLQYGYYSTRVRTGAAIDTAAGVFFPGTTFTATRFYRTGTTKNYRNQFHTIGLPLLLRYKLARTLPMYAEAGISISYLLSSNALVYSSQSGGYITEPGVFNKLLISANGGIGADLFQKSKLPFSFGYRFSYGANSITKTNFANQHLINSAVYIDIPVKK